MYLGAFAIANIDKKCGREAAKAYVDVVSLSYKIIERKRPSRQKVTSGGAGGRTTR